MLPLVILGASSCGGIAPGPDPGSEDPLRTVLEEFERTITLGATLTWVEGPIPEATDGPEAPDLTVLTPRIVTGPRPLKLTIALEATDPQFGLDDCDPARGASQLYFGLVGLDAHLRAEFGVQRGLPRGYVFDVEAWGPRIDEGEFEWIIAAGDSDGNVSAHRTALWQIEEGGAGTPGPREPWEPGSFDAVSCDEAARRASAMTNTDVAKPIRAHYCLDGGTLLCWEPLFDDGPYYVSATGNTCGIQEPPLHDCTQIDGAGAPVEPWQRAITCVPWTDALRDALYLAEPTTPYVATQPEDWAGPVQPAADCSMSGAGAYFCCPR